MMPMQPNKPKFQADQTDGGQEDMAGDSTVLSLESYPDLGAAEQGQKVMLEGTIQSNDGKDVTLSFDSVKLQTNQADKAVSRMTGKKSKPAPEPAADDTGEEGY